MKKLKILLLVAFISSISQIFSMEKKVVEVEDFSSNSWDILPAEFKATMFR